MIASAQICQDYDFDDHTALRTNSATRAVRDMPARDRMAARSRYRRSGKAAASFNGAHRRRDKRNYL